MWTTKFEDKLVAMLHRPDCALIVLMNQSGTYVGDIVPCVGGYRLRTGDGTPRSYPSAARVAAMAARLGKSTLTSRLFRSVEPRAFLTP
jgi:hypothetical protein